MNWAGKQHPIETLVEYCASAAFAGAIGWSASLVGVALPVSAFAGGVAFVAGLIAVRLIGRRDMMESPAFEPLSIEVDATELDELLLDTPIQPGAGHLSELLLDDALADIGDDARVVRLFARQEPTPGELVTRIEDFLGESSRRPPAQPPTREIPDAGAALQVALANVRASLK